MDKIVLMILYLEENGEVMYECESMEMVQREQLALANNRNREEREREWHWNGFDCTALHWVRSREGGRKNGTKPSKPAFIIPKQIGLN